MARGRSRESKVVTYIYNSPVLRSLVILLCTLLYCEKLHYFVVLLHCTWPVLEESGRLSSAVSGYGLKAMFIADTHLLGFREGHWFDKLRREWQMMQSFQTAMLIHKPDVVFVLGDLFDEGKWCNDDEFYYHTSRFKSMFAVPDGTDLFAVSGNHDEGFHYMMTRHKHKRFESEFESPSVRLLTRKGVNFVLINSMAMEGDGCSICVAAERDIRNISAHFTGALNCQKSKSYSKDCQKYTTPYSQPILLQHFPMYRKSDANCHTPDAPPETERYTPFREKFDCLDQRSTNILLSSLKPRLVVNGHTHHGCFRTLPGGVPEWTVSSFSWRNRNNPTFLMGRFTESKQVLSQCFLPEESTVVNLYILSAVIVVLNILVPPAVRRFSYRMKTY